MRKFFILIIFLIIGCATNPPQTAINPVNSLPSTNAEKIKELKFKVATIETKIKEIDKKIKELDKKVDKLITPDSSINEDTKTLILSKISELSAKQENYLMFLADINKELSEIKDRLNQGKKKLGVKNKKKAIKFKQKKSLVKKDVKSYDNCLKFYKIKSYEKAIKCFKSFTAIFKKSSLIPNAYFWIGESYFKKGDFLKAIDNYDIVLTKYPKSKKVPSALLKEGLAFYYMKDKEGAKIFLQKVINEYPATPQAYYAKRFIEKFKLK